MEHIFRAQRNPAMRPQLALDLRGFSQVGRGGLMEAKFSCMVGVQGRNRHACGARASDFGLFLPPCESGPNDHQPARGIETFFCWAGW